MEKITYNFEISTLIAQFLDAINGIKIRRWDRSDSHSAPIQHGDIISPTILYAPKQRVIHDYINNQAQHRLPVVSCCISNISRDSSRIFNNLEGPSLSYDEGGGRTEINQPIPISLQMSMSIMSKYQEDIDQILTNFIPYVKEYFVVSWPSPYLENQEIRTTVTWDGNINLEYPTDLTFNDHFRVIGNTSFTMLGWLFQAEDEVKDGFIHNIHTHFHAVSDIYCDYDSNVANANAATTDSDVISGRPTITESIPSISINQNTDSIIIGGSMFDYTSAFFLSGADLQPIEFFDFANTAVSANIPSFSALRVYPSNISQNIAVLSIPSLTATSNIDIIAINNAGVGKLTSDSVRTVTYPSPSAGIGEEGWEIYQPPGINGLEVIEI